MNMAKELLESVGNLGDGVAVVASLMGASSFVIAATLLSAVVVVIMQMLGHVKARSRWIFRVATPSSVTKDWVNDVTELPPPPFFTPSESLS
jgi:hypothetical protein